MEYSFKYHRDKGVYEVFKGNKLDMECNTMQEAQSYISSKGAIIKNKSVKQQEVKSKEPEVGFGQWGVPSYLLKAEGGKYGVKGNPTK